jgi:hypothetical protein
MTAKKTATKKAPAKNAPVEEKKMNLDNRKIPADSDDGFRIVKKAHLSPFVDWEEEPVVEGIVSNFRTVKGGKFGDQDVIDVGEHSIGITAGLVSLPDYDGKYVRIRYEGVEETKKGNTVKLFTVLEKTSSK